MKRNLTILWLATIIRTLSPAAAWPSDNQHSLETCIDIALKNNHRQQISRLAVETAEAQLQQALSSYWPQISFQSGYNRLDEDLNFIFPEETSQYTISGIGQDPVSATVNVPAKDVTVIERDNLLSRLNLMLPIFTGGMRPAVVRQAKAGVEAAQHARKRTQLELIHDVKRFYFGAILARQVAAIGDDAKVDEEKAERWPMIGATGTLWRWDHGMDNSGMGTDRNSEGWPVGVGLELPIFTGFLTTNKNKVEKVLAMGASSFLKKPCRLGDLAESVCEALKQGILLFSLNGCKDGFNSTKGCGHGKSGTALCTNPVLMG